MEPVRSNLTNKTCIDPISSNCIDWAGPAIPGICGKATITDVITKVSENASCCSGDFAAGHLSCYTGDWVDFTSFIPLSGFNSACTWTVDTAISNYGPPQYKWTRDGDLKVRGGFRIILTPVSQKGAMGFNMTSVSTSCFPKGYNNAPQFNLTVGDPLASTSNVTNIFLGGVSINSSGIIGFGGSFCNITLSVMTLDISLGGTTFNLA